MPIVTLYFSPHFGSDRVAGRLDGRRHGGPIASTLVVLALPLVVQNLGQVLNQLVDTFWLGRLGDEEVAAVGVGRFYLLRYEQMFSNAAEEAAGTATD